MPKKTIMGFTEGFFGPPATAKIGDMKTFDWDKAAKIIKGYLTKYPNLIAEAGLQGDWYYTSGTIFSEGKPVSDDYPYLASTWAVPTLILSDEGEELEEFECWIVESRFTYNSKWDEESLKILE